MPKDRIEARLFVIPMKRDRERRGSRMRRAQADRAAKLNLDLVEKIGW
jgi:hypothetical protein